MKACNACNIHVQTQGGFCPLCGGELESTAPRPCEENQPINEYPDLSGAAAQYNIIRRLFIFVSLFGSIVSVLINILVPTGFWWSLIVIASVIYCWVSVPPLLRRGVNYGARILFQTIFTSVLVILVDVIIGYKGWSATYVVPGILCASIMATWLMVAFNRTSWVQYVLYQVMMAVFALVPLVLYIIGLAGNRIMVLVTASLGLASLLITLIFGDKSIKSEFKRRFHL